MAELEDAPAIAAVLREAFAEYRPLYTQEAYAATTPTGEQIECRMQEGPVWVATKAGTIVGTVAAVHRGQDLYVRGMGVLSTARGLGIGELLLETVRSAGMAAGHRRLILSTTPFLARAIRLYERYGFIRSEEGPHELFGTPLFTMSKRLESEHSDTSAAVQPGSD
ncbi:MAG: hypothetical protein QOH93_613 [Chloroflexia bacterium]|jgi:ribosomal protein S18 acetylase RimI-like enzyme|nr:hypothetical protein [Chloroflexia bacterium]